MLSIPPELKERQKVVTRYAPSPTGFQHVGGVRTALFAWLFAQKNNGTLILRIEDTDKEREVVGAIDHAIEALHWLGINWNEGPDIGGPHAPYLQSKRLDSYKKYAEILLAKGLAYVDPYTQEQLESFRKKAEFEKKAFLYRDYRPEHFDFSWDGTKALRLKTTPTSYSWHDEVRGDLHAGPEVVDDFILMKADGYPTYNFAHIIDDLEMNVTHIFRADEFISSTPKFLALYEALSINHPAFVTLPPIMGPDGKKKLGKRDGAKDILEYRNDGIIPEAMMNFLAFIGWNPGGEKEVLDTAELIEAFDIHKIQVHGGKFNEEKLLWYNKQYIEKLPIENLVKTIHARLENSQKFQEKKYHISHDLVEKLMPLIRERIQVFSDIDKMMTEGEWNYIFEEPLYEPQLLYWKDEKNVRITQQRLTTVLERLSLVSDTLFTQELVKDAVWDYATAEGKGQVLWPLRVALTGKEKSPDPFIVAELIGKEKSMIRINKAINALEHLR